MNPRETASGAHKPAKPNGRRPGRPTLSNEELEDKTLDLFLEHGFERTSIDAITAAAGVAKRTVYLRYGDKKSLFKAALKRAIEEWIVPVERLRAAESGDLEETLLKVGHILCANMMRPAGLRLLRITNAESARMPEIGAYTYQRGTERTIAYLADLLHRRLGPDTVPMEAWTEAAIGFLFLVVGGPPTMTVWGISLDHETIENHVSYCVKLFLHGLLPRPDRPSMSDLAPDDDAYAPESADLQTLQNENRRLKKLLLTSMLDVASLREQLESK